MSAWRIEAFSNGGTMDNPIDLYEVCTDHKRICENVELEDAQLIASAPLMLDTLNKARAWIAMYHNQPGHDAASRHMTDLIDRAIAATKST